MTENEISYWIATTRVPGWQQNKASKEQIEALAARQKQMTDLGIDCWAEYTDGHVVPGWPNSRIPDRV